MNVATAMMISSSNSKRLHLLRLDWLQTDENLRFDPDMAHLRSDYQLRLVYLNSGGSRSTST